MNQEQKPVIIDDVCFAPGMCDTLEQCQKLCSFYANANGELMDQIQRLEEEIATLKSELTYKQVLHDEIVEGLVKALQAAKSSTKD